NDRADGFCGLLGTPSAERLIECYRRGLFPYSHVGPQKLWCPPQRHVLFFENYKIEKRVRRLLRQGAFTYTFDKAFARVVRECASARTGKVGLSWIRPELRALYQQAYRAGYAHSVEAWDERGELVGGAFGIVIGAVFFAESQFYRAPNASKCAYAVLNHHLQYWGFAINDAKRGSPFMAQQGYFDIPRNRYLQLLAEESRRRRGPKQWYVDPLLDTASWKPSALGRWSSLDGEPRWLRRARAA
ncbi:MAG: leucyl/phenylalanyl-tRNA--protein transferase, partial [Pseudomonadota bacterium]